MFEDLYGLFRGVDELVSKSGLTLVLTLNPFVSTDSPNFKDGVNKGIFVMERNQNNSKNIPALTWFKVTSLNHIDSVCLFSLIHF